MSLEMDIAIAQLARDTVIRSYAEFAETVCDMLRAYEPKVLPTALRDELIGQVKAVLFVKKHLQEKHYEKQVKAMEALPR